MKNTINSENEVVEIVSTIIPDFKKMIDEAVTSNVNQVIIHQDAFAADYDMDELVLLGSAVKYAGLNGVNLTFTGKNS